MDAFSGHSFSTFTELAVWSKVLIHIYIYLKKKRFEHYSSEKVVDGSEVLTAGLTLRLGLAGRARRAGQGHGADGPPGHLATGHLLVDGWNHRESSDIIQAPNMTTTQHHLEFKCL